MGKKSMNIALLLAGGSGHRCESKIPKQFIEINGKPLIIYTLEHFEKSKDIDYICVVCMDNWIKKLEYYAKKFQIRKLIKICNGGNSGLASLQNGLQSLNCNDQDYIVIHDAVRPFVDEAIIRDNIQMAHLHSMAVTAIECVETLVYSDINGYAEKMVARDGLKRVQTPQTFQYKILKDICRYVDLKRAKEPSIFALYMNMGNAVYCSKGSEKNIKITYPDDLAYFKKLFQ